MTDDFRERPQSRLTAFREWAEGRCLLSCRLIQYTGDKCTEAIEVPPDEVESEITGALCEGFGVDWDERDGTLYLVVGEPYTAGNGTACSADDGGGIQ